MVRPILPENAKILILGENPSVTDEKNHEVFSDTAGHECRKMLVEAGFDLEQIAFANVLSTRPFNTQLDYVWSVDKAVAKKNNFANSHHKNAFCKPEILPELQKLYQLIEDIKPNIIIALGSFALWALTEKSSISSYRGSQETYVSKTSNLAIPVIGTYNPLQIYKMWEWRWIAIRDLKRAKKVFDNPNFNKQELNLLTHPSYPQTLETLKGILKTLDESAEPVPLSADIETISRHIACIGIAWDTHNAICIPFMTAGHTSYFNLEEEFQTISLLSTVLTHPNSLIIGQNWSYDTQHIVRSWLFRPKADSDTMLNQHALLPGTPKDLAFLASIYCEHYVYWKDELTDYRTLPEDLEGFWRYNAKDCCYTMEIYLAQQQILKQFNKTAQADFLNRLHNHVITMMLRGTRVDLDEKHRLAVALQPEIDTRRTLINYLSGRDLNISSPKQMAEFFYDDLKMKVVRDRKTFRPTTNANALTTFGLREPILKPLTDLIEETRSIGVFLATFVLMPVDVDQRMRCNFNVGGTETFRFSSSKNPFGSGGNLQNIPKGSEDSELDSSSFKFPNLRKMFIPDPGFTLFDVDLAGADAQVVAWEAEDDDLKAKFRSGEKIHALNAKDMYGTDAGPDGKRAPYYKMAKMGCHLTNYGGTPPTLAKSCGMTIHEAEKFQIRWFELHPGIREWHAEVRNALYTKREVFNKFGFSRTFFERLDNILPEALAWIPQSTIALVINKALCNISEDPDLQALRTQLLLQVHDSLVGQFPKENRYLSLPHIRRCLSVTIPYADPLVIGTSLDLSDKSWGDLISFNWET